MTFLGTAFCSVAVVLTMTVRTLVAAQSRQYSFRSVTRAALAGPAVSAAWAAVWYDIPRHGIRPTAIIHVADPPR
jgi:hypothetical protein